MAGACTGFMPAPATFQVGPAGGSTMSPRFAPSRSRSRTHRPTRRICGPARFRQSSPPRVSHCSSPGSPEGSRARRRRQPPDGRPGTRTLAVDGCRYFGGRHGFPAALFRWRGVRRVLASAIPVHLCVGGGPGHRGLGQGSAWHKGRWPARIRHPGRAGLRRSRKTRDPAE